MSDEEENIVLLKKKRVRNNPVILKTAASTDSSEELEVEIKKGKIEKEVVISGELADELLQDRKSTPIKQAIPKEVTVLEEIKVTKLPKDKPEPASKPEKFQLNPDNTKPTCRFDYAKDLCKDYNESGYCVFGDTCIFLHDRGDYKSGWELELEWNNKVRENAKEEVNEDSTVCKICDKERTAPVSAECGHIFCESCALEAFTSSKKCPVCKKVWKGSFKVVK